MDPLLKSVSSNLKLNLNYLESKWVAGTYFCQPSRPSDSATVQLVAGPVQQWDTVIKMAGEKRSSAIFFSDSLYILYIYICNN